MIPYPEIDPVAISIGPLDIHWYGLMYLAGFGGGLWLANTRAKRPGSGWTYEMLSDLLFYFAMGVILGGRLGYVLFYNFDQFLADPLWALKVWEGGMSFHGGLLGVLAAFWYFGHKQKKSFFEVADFIAPVVPIGLGLGRLGNFIGGELWGRCSDVSWAMVFPRADECARHPSQLYQFALEGVALFALLWWFSNKPRPRMAVSGLFLIGYGSFRFLVEFVREPDSHIGFDLMGWLTRGQLLSIPMVLLGVYLMVLAYKKQRQQTV